MIKKIYVFLSKYELINNILILCYFLGGKRPWTLGYNEYKWENIRKVLKKRSLLNLFKKKNLPRKFGIGIDERIVEYPWVFANMTGNNGDKILDAGSVFNYSKILDLNNFKNKKITIFTYNPEYPNYNEKNISYLYGDLRDIPFKDEYFDEIVCQSTIEHVDMDNSIYGYDIKNSSKLDNKSYEYLKVIKELQRVLSINGELFLTFPFGRYENQGFFQQFDSEMVERIKKLLEDDGILQIDFIKYYEDGWRFVSESECQGVIPYNPHTGMGKGKDGAAHCRAVCCIKFSKK